MKANKKITAIYSAIKKAPKAERLALLRAGMGLISRANQTTKRKEK